MKRMIPRLLAAAVLAFTCIPASAAAQEAPAVGVVILHGKGGRPEGLTRPLAVNLHQEKGWHVANIEMPWSGRRQYDVDVQSAEEEVSASIKALRQSGASRIFLAGHSQGAVFAIHYATKHPLDGLVLIAAGGSVATPFYRKQIGASVDRARQLVAEGKGKVQGEFEEFEGGKGHWNVRTTAETYLSWFDAGGAMNLMKSAAALPKNLPVLQVTPTGDYPALLRAKQELFDALPAHPLKRLHEPVSNHRNAPRDAAGDIARWIAEVAAR